MISKLIPFEKNSLSKLCPWPELITGTRRNNNVIITSKWRRDVVLTSWWRYFHVVCPLVWFVRTCCPHQIGTQSPRPHDVVMTLSIRQNDVATSFWRNNCVNITPCGRSVFSPTAWKRPLPVLSWFSSAVSLIMSSNGNISALLALCAGNSLVTGEFPAQRPVTRSFDVFFDPRLNKRLNEQSWD